MLCVIKMPDWRHRLIIPFPIFLLDDVIALAAWATRFIPAHVGSNLPFGTDIKKVLSKIPEVWDTFRHAGPFTVVEFVDGSGTKVSIRMI